MENVGPSIAVLINDNNLSCFLCKRWSKVLMFYLNIMLRDVENGNRNRNKYVLDTHNFN